MTFYSPDSHPYGDIHKPAVTYPMYHLSPLFQAKQLRDRDGKEQAWEELFGKSVALLFYDHNNNKCKNLLPMLMQDYRTLNENSDRQKMEVIYIPLEKDHGMSEGVARRMPWLSLPPGDPLVADLTQHFLLTHGRNVPKFGYHSLSHIPALLVIRRDGSLLKKINVEEEGPKATKFWDLHYTF